MTPKEKAKELLNKFNNYHDKENKNYIIFQTIEESKRCALIAVDEIIDSLKSNAANSASWLYWEEVKQEI